MNKIILALPLALLAVVLSIAGQDTNSAPDWLTRPLSLAGCLNTALEQNATILKAKNDLEAQYGVVVQTRAIALPQVQATGQYKDTDPNAIESYPGTSQP